MTHKPFMRHVIDSLMPSGNIWRPAQGGAFDKLFEGMAHSKQETLDDLGCLSDIRNPYRCPVELLPDIERELGIASNLTLSERGRRMLAGVIRYKRATLATADKLQLALNRAGFGFGGHGLIVTPNSSPPADPAIVGTFYVMTAHDFPSIYCAGNEVAYCGFFNDGYFLASGDDFDHELELPPKTHWSLVFFVGGQATRTDDGMIRAIHPVDIPATRKQELHRLILRIKPLGIWANMIVNYV